MKPSILLFGLFGLFTQSACTHTPVQPQSNPDYQAPTVAPEIGEPVPVAAKVEPADSTDSQAADTIAIEQLKDTTPQVSVSSHTTPASSNHLAQELKSATKEPAKTTKKESMKVPQELRSRGKTAEQDLTKERAKAAETVKKAIKPKNA